MSFGASDSDFFARFTGSTASALGSTGAAASALGGASLTLVSISPAVKPIAALASGVLT